MPLQFHNSLSKEVESFKPQNSSKISMYVCGPTVYERPHIGNARSVVFYDLVYRLLCINYGRQNVCYVRNITDVDDKIIDAAEKNHIAIGELTSKIYTQFTNDMNSLNCLQPNIEPKATEHIPEMIEMIEMLIANKSAYEANGHVYFDVNSYKNYTALSGRSLEELESGYRIEVNESKKHPADFVLWKPAKTSDQESAKFDSPWGIGRPGWHIECSAMSTKYLGKNFDIHGGGIDLIFPHHTNEIAQSCCAHENSQYAKYWLHNGFLTVEGEKMSKSLGNYITVFDLIDKQISGEAIRYFLLSTHYRKPLNWTQKGIDDALNSVEYLHRIINDYDDLDESQTDQLFITYLNDDFNTPRAFARLHEIGKEFYKESNHENKRNLASTILGSGKLVGLFYENAKSVKDLPSEYKKLIEERIVAKKNKDWVKADQIRNDLFAKGVMLEDKPDGSTSWQYVKK